MNDELIPVDNLLKNLDFSALPQPDMIPESIKQMHRQQEKFIQSLPTYEDRIKPLTARMDSMQSELELQTDELQKLRYENMQLNAQVKVLNVTNDKQLSEISDLKASETISKNTIEELNKTINDSNKNSFIVNIVIAIISGIIVLSIEHWYDIYIFISSLL